MEEEDSDVYSSPYENYFRLLTVIKDIETGNRLTEDWFEEHKRHILKYRHAFPNFKEVNKDTRDQTFRRKADETEIILSNLVHEIRVSHMFTPKMYLLLNKRMKELCDIIWGEDELLEMMGSMRM